MHFLAVAADPSHLPFGRFGAVSKVVGEVEPLSSYQVLPDGVVVNLVMSPNSKQIAKFSIVQGARVAIRVTLRSFARLALPAQLTPV